MVPVTIDHGDVICFKMKIQTLVAKGKLFSLSPNTWERLISFLGFQMVFLQILCLNQWKPSLAGFQQRGNLMKATHTHTHSISWTATKSGLEVSTNRALTDVPWWRRPSHQHSSVGLKHGNCCWDAAPAASTGWLDWPEQPLPGPSAQPDVPKVTQDSPHWNMSLKSKFPAPPKGKCRCTKVGILTHRTGSDLQHPDEITMCPTVWTLHSPERCFSTHDVIEI